MNICNKILVPVIILILLSQILAGHHNDFVPRIINGYPCGTKKIPFYVMILHRSACGGSLITYDWVLTASHCILSKLLYGVIGEVHSGFDLSPEFRQRRSVKEVYQHPNFSENEFLSGDDLRYDVGLVLVNESFSQNSAIRVATFPSPGYTKHCKEVTAAGTGTTFKGEDVLAKPMVERPILCVNLSIVNNCQESFPGTIFNENIFCAFSEKKDTCSGDSGGPILCDNSIIGIVSYGPTPCGVGNRSGVYTMVENYHDFIDSIVKFSAYDVKDGPVNETSGNDKSVNSTNGNDKKVKKARANNVVQAKVANWKLIFITLLCYFVSYS